MRNFYARFQAGTLLTLPQRIVGALLLLGVFSAFLPFKILQSGLDNPDPVGPFINNVLPKATPSGAVSWTSEHIYTNLTFIDPVQLLEVPGRSQFLMAGKSGYLWLFDKDLNTTTKTVALDITGQVKTSGDEGLLGVVFHPEFGQTGSPNSQYLYVYYRYVPPAGGGGSGDAYCRLSRFYVNPGTDTMPADSEYVMIQQFDRHQWHNGGGMFFGQDGFLYLTSGDEGGANDQFNSGQKINESLFGGILRIDVDKDPSRSHPIRRQPQNPGTPPASWPNSYTHGYYIPDDNPWLDAGGGLLEEFYAIGLRSPHRMTYDTLTGDIWIGDVGQGSREEISMAFKGANMQWPYKEGDINGPKAMPSPLIGTDRPPAVSYPRSVGNCVIGGFVYRGNKWPQLYGKYLFGDHSQRKVWALDYDPVTNSGPYNELTTIPAGGTGSKAGISSFSTDSTGEIYILKLNGTNLDGGIIYRLKPTAVTPEPPDSLEAVGVFQDMINLTPAPGMIPYGLQQPFWSDAAIKSRWMILPNDGIPDAADEQIVYSEDGEWQYPKGTVMVKHFEMAMDETNPSLTQRIETRLLVHDSTGNYYGVSYRWRDDQTDADLLHDGRADTLSIATSNGPREIVWQFPSRSQCLTCHNEASGGVLGPRTRQLNGLNYYPSTGRDANQIKTLEHLNFFTTSVDTTNLSSLLTSAPADELSYSLEERARTYLDANCSYCHRPDNSIQADFDARLSTALNAQELLYGNTYNSLGLSGMQEIVPGDLEHSMIYKRISAVHEDFAMPPLAKNLRDSAGVQLIADWITSMAPNQSVITTNVIADFSDDFNGNTAAAGWSYLWNANGAIGDASNYIALLPTGTTWDSDGTTGVPDATDLAWGYFNATGGHVGRSSGQGQAFDRYVIAAYTISQAGEYSLSDTEYTDGNANCGDGSVVEVYVNNTLITSGSFPNGGSTTFDVDLGTLSPGDVIYVAAGPGPNNDSCDGFGWDFSVSRTETTTQQRILFPEIAAAHLGDGPITLGASASSSLPIVYTVVSGPATVSGNILTLTGTSGYVTVSASQGGDATFAAAADIERTFVVSPIGSGDGTGLLGTYFNNADKTDIALYRTDANLDFYWGSGSPDPAIEFNSYSIVWEGEIEAPVSGQITFLATTDDGVRVYVNNQLIIDEWQDQARTTHAGSINMTAWQRVPIRVEFYEEGAYAAARLEWTAGNLDRAIVPTEFLYPALESSFPVEWLGFEAQPEGQAVWLDWQTGSEVNSDHFVVERSADGLSFEALEQQPAAGYSERQLSYQYQDQRPLQGRSYYRIKAVDLDGSFSYSEIRSVRLSQHLVRAYPTPLQADGLLRIETRVPAGTLVKARLMDLKGQIVKQAQWQATGDANPHNWPLSGLAKGVYILEIQVNGETDLIKVRL